ncbi:Tripartite motif-containing protein 2, partial [Cichlidogyrus casuarinus]
SEARRKMSTGGIDTLRDMITCPIDYQEFDDPRMLPCGHVYCRNCLDRYLEKIHKLDARGHKILECPVCRKQITIDPHKGASSLNPSFNHNKLISFVKKYFDHQDDAKQHETEDVEEHTNASIKRRKSSVYSQELVSEMVNTLILEQADTRNADQIISSVNDYLSIHGARDHPVNFINTTPQFLHSMSQPTVDDSSLPLFPMPSAPPLDDSYSNSSHQRTPGNSERFSGATNHLRAPERPPSPENEHNDAYLQSRSVENVRVSMRRNCSYSRLHKDEGYCVLEGCVHGACVDMQLMSIFSTDCPKLNPNTPTQREYRLFI